MTLAALAFAAGAALLQLQAALPSMVWFALLPFCLAGLWFKPRLAPAFTFTIGFLWAAAMAHVRMADWLPPELEGRDLDVVGVVSSLPAAAERATRGASSPATRSISARSRSPATRSASR